MTKRCSAGAAVLAMALFAPVAAFAQTAPEPCESGSRGADGSCEPASATARWLERYRTLKLHGVTPRLGTIVPGSNLSAGGELRRDRLFGISAGVSVSGMWSIRGYRQYELRLGRIRGDRNRAELRPITTDITSAFSDGSLLAKGVSAYFENQRILYPRVDFFGLGQESAVGDRADFALSGGTKDGVIQWQHSAHLGLSARAGSLALDVADGRNREVPSLATRYTPDSAPAMNVPTHYLTAGGAIVLDYRNKPRLTSHGTWAGIGLWVAKPIPTSELSDKVPDAVPGFSRAVIDVRHFQALPDPDHVVALRTLVSTRVGDISGPTPFYLQPTLGGSKTLRGFGSYRLRGETLWAATVEYRWHAARWIEVVPGLDVGAVADSFGGLQHAKPAVTPVIGIRGRTEEQVFGRLDVSAGRDGLRAVLTIGSPF